MNLTKNLTNERLKGLFSNNFDLTNYAIKIAKAQVLQNEQPIKLDPFIDQLRETIIKDREEHKEE